jgi:hypothetical protein
MAMSQDRMVQLVRQDVLEMIADRGVEATSEEYGVDFDGACTRAEFVDRCVAEELSRCYA